MSDEQPIFSVYPSRSGVFFYLLVVVFFSVTAAMCYLLWLGYRDAISVAEIASRNYAAIIETRLDATLRRADAILLERVRTLPADALTVRAVPRYARDIDAMLDSHLINFPELVSLRVMDANGNPLYTSSRAHSPVANIADRGYFRQLRDNPGAELVFSEVIVGRSVGRPSMVIARGLRNEEGIFRGIVFAGIDLDYFRRIFQTLDVGAHGSIGVFRSDDFREVVRLPTGSGELNRQLPPENPARRIAASGRRVATIESPAAADGFVRIFSYHALERYPLFVSVGLAREDVLAGWKTRALVASLGGLLLLGMLAVLIVQLWRSEVRKAKALSDLEQSEGRFRAIFKHAGVGIAMRPAHDRTHRWTQINDQFCKLLGYTREELLKMSTADITPPDEIQSAVKDNQRLIRGDVESYSREKRIIRKDGSSIWVIIAVAALPDAHGRPKDMISVYQDITERKQAEEALRRSETNLRALSDNASVGILVILQGRYVFANGYAARMLGYSVEELEQISLADIIHPDYRPLLFERHRRRLAGEDIPSRYEAMALAKDGHAIPVELNAAITHWNGQTADIVFISDITARKQAEAALRTSEEKYRSIYENIQDVYVESTVEGTVIEISPQIEVLSGGRYVRADLIGKPSVMFYSEPARRAEFLRILRERGSVKDFQVKLLNRDGSPVFCSVSARLIFDQEGKPQRVVATLRDVSERIRGEEQRKALESQLFQAQKMEAIGTLSGGIAHDFNNILGAIIGNVELARQDVEPDHVAQQSLEEIAKAGRRGKDLVQQILTFSHKQEPQRRIVSLPSVIDEVVKLMRAALPANIHFTKSLSPEASKIQVLADPTQVHQVVMNLCTNAAHAMEGKPGRIDLRLDYLEIENENTGPEDLQRGRYAHLSVRDTGSGMDSGTLARIFEPFFTTKAVGEGTGLGLSVVHGIMQAHDGVVRAESRPGKGSTFHLYFPVVDHEAEVVEALKTDVPASAGHGKRVLYVDDDEALVLMVTRLLERQDYRVSGHTWAKEAIDELRADPLLFDLVVTDYNMPGMSGLDVAREIRAIRPDLPVVLTSGYITDELRAKATEAGVRNLLYKPNTVQELCETVQTLTSELTEKKPSVNKEQQ